MPGYVWAKCDDFDIPHNSIRCGSDDDGSVRYCGKALFDGKEVPAKLVPNKRECRVQCGRSERIVPHCSKVLICKRVGNTDDFCRPRHHHRPHGHHRRHHNEYDRECCIPTRDCDDEETTITKTESDNKNECKTFVRTVKINSSRCTVTVKKQKKRPKCWIEKRTRMVPKVTYEKKIRYEPKEYVQKKVTSVPETYETVVCADRCESRRPRCEPCRPRCEPCRPRCEPCREPSYESDYCERDLGCGEPEVIVRPRRCSSPSPFSRDCY